MGEDPQQLTFDRATGHAWEQRGTGKQQPTQRANDCFPLPLLHLRLGKTPSPFLLGPHFPHLCNGETTVTIPPNSG